MTGVATIFPLLFITAEFLAATISSERIEARPSSFRSRPDRPDWVGSDRSHRRANLLVGLVRAGDLVVVHTSAGSF